MPNLSIHPILSKPNLCRHIHPLGWAFVVLSPCLLDGVLDTEIPPARKTIPPARDSLPLAVVSLPLAGVSGYPWEGSSKRTRLRPTPIHIPPTSFFTVVQPIRGMTHALLDFHICAADSEHVRRDKAHTHNKLTMKIDVRMQKHCVDH